MAGDIHQSWKDTSARLRQLLNRDSYDRWISGIVPLGMEDGICRLGVSNDIFCDWLANHYQETILDALKEATGREWKIRFESGHEPPRPAAILPPHPAVAAAPAKPAAEEHAPAEPADTGHYNRHFTFDTFVVGENNKFTHAACSAVAEKPGKAYNPLFVYGGTGLGKTHLLHAIAQDLLGRRRRAKVEYLTSEEFANRFIDALRDKGLPKFRQYFRNLDLLLIDDVQFFKGKEQFQEEFFHTFNALYHAHKQIVLVSDRAPHEIDGLEKRLVSRFEWGLTTEIQTPDLETRLAILRKKQADHTVKISDDVLALLATRVKSNIRRLEGALVRLVSYASVMGTPVTVDIAEKQLQAWFDDDQANSAVSIERIQRIVAEYYDVRLADMTSKRRPANIAMPRQVAMYLCRRFTDYSSPAIGEAFSRNHATILHAVETIQARMDKDAEFRQAVSVLERKLKT